MAEITKGSSSIIGSFTNVLKNFIWKISCIGGVGGILLTGILYMKQESLLYHPVIGDMPKETSQNPRDYRSPSEYRIPYESHMIRCEDGVTIHSWLLLQRNSRECPTIIFFHGNAGNIGFRLPNAHKMFREVKVNILMVEYRGFGDSESVKPTEVGLKLDAEAALNFIRTRSDINPERIFCFGRSLGGAVAFHLAQYSEKNKDKNGPLLAGLIVENTFLSISKMVDKLLPFLTPLKFLVLRIGWDSERIAPMISLPLLYLAGDSDELVPFSHMKELFALSSKSSTYTRMHIIRGGMHNDSWSVGGKEYYAQMRAFVTHVVTNNGDMGRQPSDWSEVEVSVDGTINHDKSSIAIGMGEAEKSTGITSIPIMPTNLVSMAKEAAKEASRLSKPQASDKKIK